MDTNDDANETSVSSPAITRQTSKSSANSKDHKSSKELCEEMGITNIDIVYTDEDFQSLVTYKLFNQHIRPMLSEKNPKLVMHKMVTVIGAKWREFIELKEQRSQKQAPKSDHKTTVDMETEKQSNEQVEETVAVTPATPASATNGKRNRQ